MRILQMKKGILIAAFVVVGVVFTGIFMNKQAIAGVSYIHLWGSLNGGGSLDPAKNDIVIKWDDGQGCGRYIELGKMERYICSDPRYDDSGLFRPWEDEANNDCNSVTKCNSGTLQIDSYSGLDGGGNLLCSGSVGSVPPFVGLHFGWPYCDPACPTNRYSAGALGNVCNPMKGGSADWCTGSPTSQCPDSRFCSIFNSWITASWNDILQRELTGSTGGTPVTINIPQLPADPTHESSPLYQACDPLYPAPGHQPPDCAPALGGTSHYRAAITHDLSIGKTADASCSGNPYAPCNPQGHCIRNAENILVCSTNDDARCVADGADCDFAGICDKDGQAFCYQNEDGLCYGNLAWQNFEGRDNETHWGPGSTNVFSFYSENYTCETATPTITIGPGSTPQMIPFFCTPKVIPTPPNIEDVWVSPVGRVAPTLNPVLGTEQDADNDPTCVANGDNNPSVYVMTASDQGGAETIDIMQLNLAPSSKLPTPPSTTLTADMYDHWPLRLMFAKNWSGLGAGTPAFYVRDAAISESPVAHCYDDSGNPTVTVGSSLGCWYKASVTHNWEAATTTTADINGDGTNETIYYLASNIQIYGNGYNTRLMGNAVWQNATHVEYYPTTKTAVAYFVLTFLDNGNKTWEGNFEDVWFVGDTAGASDGSLLAAHDSAPYTDVLSDGSTGSFHKYGDTKIDFTAPTGQAQPFHNVADAPDKYRFNQEAHDNLASDSGLKRIYSRIGRITHEGGGSIDTSIGANLNLGGVANWPVREEGSVTGVVEGDTVCGIVSIADQVCNFDTEQKCIIPQLGDPWMQTLNGDVYATRGFSNPIPLANTFLSRYWAGGRANLGDSSWNFGSEPGKGGASGPNSGWVSWPTDIYADKNKDTNWYDDIYRLAERSGNQLKDPGSLTLYQVITDSANQGIYVFPTSSTVTVQGLCNGAKVIFFPNSTEVRITPNAMALTNTSACLIVARNGVTVRTGINDDTERINFAIITNGTFKTDVDADRNKLRINGLVFANDTLLQRTLTPARNLTDPAETFNYDPRYLELLRNLIGRRPYSQLECGIVSDAPVCSGWD